MASEEEEPLVGEGKSPAYTPRSTYQDHFSLEAPSDEIRFRTNSVRVFSSGTEQIQVVEENPSNEDENEEEGGTGGSKLKVKVSSDGSSGLSMLRGAYTLVCILMLGFLLIFCLQVLLFLFVSLVTEGGLTSKQRLNFAHLFGALLSIPLFVYGLASALTMATEFVVNTWHGHQFLRSVLRWSPTFIDWFAFIIFLGVPLLVLIHGLFTSEHWWEHTALAWFTGIGLFYALFCLIVFIFEIWGALELMSHHPDYELVDLGCKNVGVFFKRAILMRQMNSYSAVRHRTFYIEGAETLPLPNESYENSDLADKEFRQESISSYSRLMLYLAPHTRHIVEYETPKRQFNVEDVLDRTVFVTDATWNLEKFYCRRSKARTALVATGPSHVTTAQMWSSLACASLGNFLVVFFVAGLLSWGGIPIWLVVVLTALFVYFNRASFRRLYSLYDSYKDVTGDGAAVSGASEIIYQVTETHRLTRPTEMACWILFAVEIFFFFLFPFWMLWDVGNLAIAWLFLILGGFSACRHYFNAPVVLSELGSLDLLDGSFIRGGDPESEEAAEDAAEQDWREKNRMSKIVGQISQGARRDTWVSVIFTFVMIFLFLFLSAFAGGSNSGAETDTSNILHDFHYSPQPGTFQYPTCAMTDDFAIPTGETNSTHPSTLADYAYIASIAYTAPESMEKVLDAWFGEGVVKDNLDLVTEFRSKREESAVHFKLLTFPYNPEFAVVTIRGTNNGWDMISDAQLWSASYLAQMVRGLLPAGEIWNPILTNLVAMIGVLQNESLQKVAFYVTTSAFVDWLREKNLYPALRVTGHSLGVRVKTKVIGAKNG